MTLKKDGVPDIGACAYKLDLNFMKNRENPLIGACACMAMFINFFNFCLISVECFSRMFLIKIFLIKTNIFIKSNTRFFYNIE